MANRRRIRRAKHIDTVSKRCKIARRRAMRTDNETKLVLRLKLLGSGMMIPGRSKLVRDIEQLTLMPLTMPRSMLRKKAFRKSYKHKSLKFIIKECYRLISCEKDQDVLYGLLKLARVFQGSRIERCAALEEYSDVIAVIDLLNHFPAIRVRCAAIALLCERYDTRNYEGKYSDSVVFYVCAILTASRVRNSQLPEVPEKCIDEGEEENSDDPFSYAKTRRMEYAEVHLAVTMLKTLIVGRSRQEKYLCADTISYICRDDDVMSIVFEGIRNWTLVPKRCYDDEYVFCDVLYYLLEKSTRDTDRDYLIARYEAEIRVAFREFPSVLLILLLERRPQIAAVIVRDDATLHTVWSRMNNKCACAEDNHSIWQYELPVLLLDHCLQTANSSLLQKLLGMGFLTSARFWALDDSMWEDPRTVSDIFRDVLAARPEWRQRFRTLTAVGWRGRRGRYRSLTARLGAAIPERVPKPTLYVLEEDVDVV